jgi:predicted ATPase
MNHPFKPPGRLRVRLVSLHVAGYRSIRAATLHLSPITLLVGPNGVGKSNLLDALAFFTDAITLGLPQAINLRGGVQGLRHRVASPNSGDHPADAIFFEAVFHLSGRCAIVNIEGRDDDLEDQPFEQEISYRFTLRFDPEGQHWVEGEKMSGVNPRGLNHDNDRIDFDGWFSEWVNASYKTQDGEIPTAPLVIAFERYAFDDLQALRRSQRYEPVTVLDARGQYLNSVWYGMERAHGEAAARVVALLGQVVPGVEAIKAVKVSRFLEVEVTLRGEDGRRQVLPLDSMSDGFVRAFAVLVAVYQPNRPDLIALDEVEASLHPAAAARLFLALQSAPEPMPQLLLTTHSPALLDSGGVRLDMLRVVAWRDGETRVGPVAAAQVALIKQRLVTGAELLAEGALRMDDAP